MERMLKRVLSFTLSAAIVLTSFTIPTFAQSTPKDEVGVSYSSHVQDRGWMPEVSNGQVSGTTGLSMRMEALQIHLTNLPAGAGINYRVHVQDIGWMPEVNDGIIAGTSGQKKRIEAISISLSGLPGYSVKYRVHVQDYGWMDWHQDGSIAGTTGQSKRLEAIQIIIVPPETEIPQLPVISTINIAAIQGVTVPATGATPVTSITETSQYTGTVVWEPEDVTFLENTSYTATITLTPKAGYTLSGVTANYFTVAGAASSNTANSGIITAIFPATPRTISIAAILGVTAPVNGATPVTAITETAQYTGTVTWAPSVGTFGSNTSYTATITLTAKTGFTLAGVAANFFTVSGAATDTNTANSGVITAVFPATATTVNIAAVPGVTVPVNGATPVTTITDTAQYTGTVAWAPAVGTFGSNTSYTATITLTAKTGFTLAGVAADFFTAAGAATDTNPANSGVITAVFPATATTINIAAVPGVTVPVNGAAPVTTITETAQYTGTVAWAPSAGTFGSNTSYTATITLTPKTGFTLAGVAADFFTVAGASTDTNTANSGVITAVFPATATTINIAAVPGVTVPANGATPVTSITETAQYTGTVVWVPTGVFAGETQYTATITLTAKTGFTLAGVAANFFTVAGAATDTNAAGSGIITAVFPTTDATINIAAVPGVTVPVNGATPVTTITETAQYTGTVAWAPSAGTFGSNTSYTATITLTAKTGFTLAGVTADFFTVAGATTDTNTANSGVITAVFPATATTINIAAIQGVTVPVNGATPVTTITETAQYTGTVSWTPSAGTFGSNTSYTATITLTPKTGFTLTGVTADFFTVAGTTSDTNTANSGIITAVFPATATTINIAAIPGVTVPVTGATPVTTITQTAQYTGTVIWAPSDGAFGSNTSYTATITLTPKTGFTLTGVTADFFTVAGTTSDTNTANSGVITAVFPATATTINIAAVPGVTVPVNGATPVTTITETAQYTGTVAWAPSAGTFGSNTSYTATITLTAKTGFTLAGVAADFFTVAGTSTDTNTANSGVITAVFPATATTINIAAIQGVTVPVNGATPVTTVTETAQYTGTVEWLPTGIFAAETQYTATITLTAKTGFTLTGVAADFFTVAGTTSDTNTANSGIVTAAFPTTATTINIAAIPGVTVPVNGAAPVTTITETAQYTGTVSWTPSAGTFGSNTSYTATITLTPKTGFTVTGVTADFFTVAGTTSDTNTANSGIITAVFPATATTINIAAIPGVTVPVTGATPVTTITDTAQYTGTVSWSPSAGTFASNTSYTATITLTAKSGFTLAGVAADFFTVAGTSTDTNTANSGVITAVFPATATTINIAAIPGVTVPVAGATPVTTITDTAQYTGTVSWLPTGNFAAETQYTATITLTAKAGFTLTGVSANFFTVAGATTHANAANSGVITAVFPATGEEATMINIAAIQGVTVPVTGATPVTTITQTAQYTGTVSWSPAPGGSFAAATIYTATITLTAKTGFTLAGVAANFFTVAGTATDTNPINSGVITAVFPATATPPTTYMLKAALNGSWADASVASGSVSAGYSIYSINSDDIYAINVLTGAIQYRTRGSSSWFNYNTEYLYGYVSEIPAGYQPLAVLQEGLEPFIINPSTGTIMYDMGSGLYENGGQSVIDTVAIPGGYTPLGAYELPITYEVFIVLSNASGNLMQRSWLTGSYSSVGATFPAIPAGYTYAGLNYESGILYKYIVLSS